ncbi:MAG: hypothetical protein HY211_08355 [Candidatus Omnitrophica bacterium]|nr:hypothetical protein [Candidatus Omnitrophota bacterium]
MAPGRRDISLTTDPVDYGRITQQHPWILTEGQQAVLSPDSDGFLCALFLSRYLKWKIVGFYDGKILLLQKGLSAKKCVFLDMEIFRPDVRSVGQHMLLYNKNGSSPFGVGRF